MDSRIAVFLVASAALLAAHHVADHWLQTEHQADTKGAPGWTGRRACAGHVGTYTAAQAAALLLAAAWLDLTLSVPWTAAGLALSGLTHYVADRRAPLRWLAERFRHAPFFSVNTGGINGAYLMDQSYHFGWIFLAALVIAGP